MEQIVKEALEAVVNTNQNKVEAAQLQAVVSELHSLELALVGGGSAVVAF